MDSSFDFVLAGQIWAFPFCFMIGLYFLSRNAQMILHVIKHW